MIITVYLLETLERARLTLPCIRVGGRPDLSLRPIFVNFPGCDNYDYRSVADIVDGYNVRDRSDLPPSRESANFVDVDNAVAPNQAQSKMRNPFVVAN
jgi:hypothetical protein